MTKVELNRKLAESTGNAIHSILNGRKTLLIDDNQTIYKLSITHAIDIHQFENSVTATCTVKDKESTVFRLVSTSYFDDYFDKVEATNWAIAEAIIKKVKGV